MKLVVGTRGSRLSLIQTEQVLESLKRVRPYLKFEVKIIRTMGDIERHKPLYAMGRKGIFEKEIDLAVIKGEIDLAVHSLKDVPTLRGDEEVVIAAIPKRASPLEALVSRDSIPLKMLPKGAIVGTSSLRRMVQIKFLRPDLEVKPIRGNVDTRLRKVKSGDFHAVVLAYAGLERLGLTDLVAEVFSPETFTPAAGQGALAVVVQRDRGDLIDLLKEIDHPPTRAEVVAERSLVAALEGGCHFPIGVYAHAESGKLVLYGCIFSVDARRKIEVRVEGSLSEAEDLGKRAARALSEKGADEIKAQWREVYGLW
jgi:hydroxymethylbilane synthase